MLATLIDVWIVDQHPSLVNAYHYAGGVDTQWLSMTSFLWYLYRIPSHVGSFRELDFGRSIFDKTTRDDSFDAVSHLWVDSSSFGMFKDAFRQRHTCLDSELSLVKSIDCKHKMRTWLFTDVMYVCVCFLSQNYRIYRHVMHISFFFPMSFAPFWIFHCSPMPATFLPRPLFLLCFAKNKSLCTILHSVKLTASPENTPKPQRKGKSLQITIF